MAEMNPEDVQDFPLDDLHPGEVVVKDWILAELATAIRDSKLLAPINCVRLHDRLIVRDGNNRVRALVEFSQNGPPVTMRGMIAGDPPTEVGARMLTAAARFYGSGAAAFTALPSVGESEYDKRHGEESRKLLNLLEDTGQDSGE